MAANLSTRKDALSPSLTGLHIPDPAQNIAKAEGLTIEEAFELAAYLRDAGYDRIEVVHQPEQSIVTWQK